MKLDEICLIITQLPPALIHSDSDADYHVAVQELQVCLLYDLCCFTHIVKKAMCGVTPVRRCQCGWSELRGLALQADPPTWALLAAPGPTPCPHYPPDSLHSSSSSSGTNPDWGVGPEPGREVSTKDTHLYCTQTHCGAAAVETTKLNTLDLCSVRILLLQGKKKT